MFTKDSLGNNYIVSFLFSSGLANQAACLKPVRSSYCSLFLLTLLHSQILAINYVGGMLILPTGVMYYQGCTKQGLHFN